MVSCHEPMMWTAYLLLPPDGGMPRHRGDGLATNYSGYLLRHEVVLSSTTTKETTIPMVYGV